MVPESFARFPYYKVYFKLNDSIRLETKILAFPYYKVYFKRDITITAECMNLTFPYYKVYFKLELLVLDISSYNTHFHTIKSILNMKA